MQAGRTPPTPEGFALSICDEVLSEFRLLLGGVGNERLRGFLNDLDWAMPRRDLLPNPLACLAHLPRIADGAWRDARPLARLLDAHGRALHWGQTYKPSDFGQRFIDNYGWLEVFGTRGHFANERVAGGFLILGPDTVYPDHHHEAEEIYIPLSGTALWRKGEGGFEARRPGEVIHHPSKVNHAMRTGETPLLALYLWRGGPLAARSTIAGRSGA